MSENANHGLSGVPETLLIPLCYRAIETPRPDALIKDEKAVELVKQLSSDGSVLFLAEGVFMYFEEAQVKSLVLTLRDQFPGAELVFDAWRPFEIWIGNLVLGGLLRWGLWRCQELEGWGDGIRLLSEWGYFDRPEPRLHPFRWMAPIFRLLKPMRIFHFRLGRAVELSNR